MATTVYKKSAMLTDKPMHYCPGCAHGLVHKLVAGRIGAYGQPYRRCQRGLFRIFV